MISLSLHKAKSLRKETCFQMGPFCQKGVFPVTAGLLLCVIPKGILDGAHSLKWEQICAQLRLSPTSALPPSCYKCRRGGGHCSLSFLLLLIPRSPWKDKQLNGKMVPSTASFELPSKAIRDWDQEETILSPGMVWIPLEGPGAPASPFHH